MRKVLVLPTLAEGQDNEQCTTFRILMYDPAGDSIQTPGTKAVSLSAKLVWWVLCFKSIAGMLSLSPYKSIAGRYRPVRVADGPITVRYRFMKNASWVA